MDVMVKEVQQWLNDTYPMYFNSESEKGPLGSYPVEIDGKTGGVTVKALIMALQIELGLSQIDGGFGPDTISHYIPVNYATINKNLVKVVQGGLYCKGYDPKGFDGGYGNNTNQAVGEYCVDLGFSADFGHGSVPCEILKSLLTTDACVPVAGTNIFIRKAQQYLNAQYGSYYWRLQGLVPTNGIYERKTNTALIYALQVSEGMDASTANGNFGPATKSKCPIIATDIADVHGYTAAEMAEFIRIAQYALWCNQIDFSGALGTYDSETVRAVKAFQKIVGLGESGVIDLNVWMALLVSSGNPDRSCAACDTATQLDRVKVDLLYDNGFRYVGRYITGQTKILTAEEVDLILGLNEDGNPDATIVKRLKLFPIYQTSADKLEYFSKEQGEIDAADAYSRADNFRIPFHSVIYFAVDYDFLDNQMDGVIKYFEAIRNYLNVNKYGDRYLIGIYGSRNVCETVRKNVDIDQLMVADASTGYSGNKGFAMPQNWAYDQFVVETKITSADGSVTLGIDKDAVSGMDNGVSSLWKILPSYRRLEYDFLPDVLINRGGNALSVYDKTYPTKKVGEIPTNAFYIRIHTGRYEYGRWFLKYEDKMHPVIFTDDNRNLCWGYIDEKFHEPDAQPGTTDEYNDTYLDYQENYCYYHFDGEELKEIKQEDFVNSGGEQYRKFIVKQDVSYYDYEGKRLGKLPVGTELLTQIGQASVGASLIWCLHFLKVKRPGANDYSYLNNSQGAYVDLGFWSGNYGAERAIW